MAHSQAAIPPSPPFRQGPRPLPLHLMAQASTLMASCAALPFLKNGSLPWRPNLAERAQDLRQSLAAAGPDAFASFEQAVATETLARHRGFLAGIEAYRRHPYQRELPPVPVLWRQGTTELLDYRDPLHPEGLPVLVVPSLVNRAYVLDLLPGRSLMRALAGRGLAPFLVDWTAPGPEECGFTLTDYVVGRLEAAVDVVTARTGRKPALLGYCMGGLLALALAQRRPDAVASLTLLATPWDFHAGNRAAQGMVMQALAEPMTRGIATLGQLPVDLLQALFMTLDPSLTERKYAAFSRMAPRSARARDFVALEDWANDGVPLAGPVATECLVGWYGANSPAKGEWSIAGIPVRPADITIPTLLVVPERDRIVPPDSALPLGAAIAHAQVMTAKGGHVGMLLSRRATSALYAPLAKWLAHSALQ